MSQPYLIWQPELMIDLCTLVVVINVNESFAYVCIRMMFDGCFYFIHIACIIINRYNGIMYSPVVKTIPLRVETCAT